MVHPQMVFTHATRTVTVSDWDNWLANAQPGDITKYHEGFIAYEMQFYTDIKQSRYLNAEHITVPETGPEFWRLARTALLASDDGLVHLVQMRMHKERYRYYAIRAAPKKLTGYVDRSGKGRHSAAQ